LERHFGRLPALAARRLEHLAATAARSTTVTAAAPAAAGAALGLAGRAAFRATIGLVLEAFAREELLLSRTKNELAVTINAAQGFICVHYWDSFSLASDGLIGPAEYTMEAGFANYRSAMVSSRAA
jgi:hypothetical protein